MSPEKSDKKVLIVDDDPNILKVLDILLSRDGYQTETAQSGGEAIEKVLRFSPDLIIMDIVLPDIDGAEAVTLMLRQRLFSEIPVIIFISGIATCIDQDYPTITVDKHEYLLIPKPLNIDKFKATIKVLLN